MQVLLLNNTYEALSICNTKRALKLIWKGRAITEASNGDYINSISQKFECPTVIRLINFVKVPRPETRVTRENIFLRDNYTCQYCGKNLSPRSLTVDHIYPISKGGKTSWKNTVTACKKCNFKKGNMSVKEAKLNLLKNPSSTKEIMFYHVLREKAKNNKSWQKFLFFDF